MQLASDAGTVYSPHGMLGYLLNDLEWLAKNANDATRPVFPVYLDILDTDTGVVQGAKAANNKKLESITTSWKELNDEMVHSIDGPIKLRYEDFETGQILHSIKDLFELINVAEGTLTATDYDELDAVLRTPLDTASRVAFGKLFQEWTNIFATKGTNSDPEIQKMRLLKHAVSSHPFIEKALKDYIDENPLLATQTFQAAGAFISLRLSNYSETSARDMGYSALTRSVTSPSFTQRDLDAARDAGYAEGLKTGGRSKDTRKPGATADTYCYKHGKVGHAGTACWHMTTGKDATAYTDGMRTARSPTDVPRGTPPGNVKNCL